MNEKEESKKYGEKKKTFKIMDMDSNIRINKDMNFNCVNRSC